MHLIGCDVQYLKLLSEVGQDYAYRFVFCIGSRYFLEWSRIDSLTVEITSFWSINAISPRGFTFTYDLLTCKSLILQPQSANIHSGHTWQRKKVCFRKVMLVRHMYAMHKHIMVGKKYKILGVNADGTFSFIWAVKDYDCFRFLSQRTSWLKHKKKTWSPPPQIWNVRYLEFKMCLACFCASEATPGFQHVHRHVTLSVIAKNQ